MSRSIPSQKQGCASPPLFGGLEDVFLADGSSGIARSKSKIPAATMPMPVHANDDNASPSGKRPANRGKALWPWVIAAIAHEGGPTTAARIAALCPLSPPPEPHFVSQALGELRKRGQVELIGVHGGKPHWRNLPGVVVDHESLLRIQETDRPGIQPLRSDPDKIRQELLTLLSDHRPRTKHEIMRKCPSARTEHEPSQQLNHFVDKRVLMADGHGRRRLYWMPNSKQMDLLELAMVSGMEVRLVAGEGQVSLVLQEGKAKKTRKGGPGVFLQYDDMGLLIRIDVFLKETLHV